MFDTQLRVVRVAARHLGPASTLEIAERCGLTTSLTLSYLKALESQGKVEAKGRKWVEIPDAEPCPLVAPPESSRSDLDSEVVHETPRLPAGCVVFLAFFVLAIIGLAVWMNQ